MKLLLTALAATTALTALAPAAMAQPYGYGPDRREIRQDRRDIREDRHDLRHDQKVADRHWRQGERLDRRYGGYATVNDWQSRRLPPPRRGYHWVRSGDDYVLAALTTGVIASVIAANR